MTNRDLFGFATPYDEKLALSQVVGQISKVPVPCLNNYAVSYAWASTFRLIWGFCGFLYAAK